jgi:hypothetical protein
MAPTGKLTSPPSSFGFIIPLQEPKKKPSKEPPKPDNDSRDPSLAFWCKDGVTLVTQDPIAVINELKIEIAYLKIFGQQFEGKVENAIEEVKALEKGDDTPLLPHTRESWRRVKHLKGMVRMQELEEGLSEELGRTFLLSSVPFPCSSLFSPALTTYDMQQIYDLVEQVPNIRASLIEAAKLLSMREWDEFPRERTEVVERQQRKLMPGLAQGHVHMDSFGGWGWSPWMDDDDDDDEEEEEEEGDAAGEEVQQGNEQKGGVGEKMITGAYGLYPDLFDTLRPRQRQ